MNCPICGEQFNLTDLELSPAYLASDYSYATAEATCPHCGEELEFYYPLTEINGVEIK